MTTYKLGDITDFNKRTINKSDSFKEILYLDTSSITENFISDTTIIDINNAPSRAQRRVENNTIVYSTVRPRLKHYGLLRNPQINLIVSTGFITIDIKNQYKNDIDPRYLYLLLTQPSITEYVGNIADTAVSAYPSINPSDISSLTFNFPTLDIQQSIADLWENYEREIALNRAINDNLEAMAKQLYDYWFVQFDFPNEEGKPYKSSGGKMVWNEKLKRMIPDGWFSNKLGELIEELESGKRPKGGIDKNLKEGIPNIGAEAISKLGDFDFSKTPYIPYGTKITSGIVRNNDILVYKDGAYVGKTTIYRDGFPYNFTTINEHVFLMRTIDPRMQEYLFFTLKKDYFFDIMQNLGKAKAAQPGLNQEDIKGIEILFPSKEVVYRFKETTEPLMARIFNNSKQIERLTKQRDELLPLLMNGQVSVNYHLSEAILYFSIVYV